METRYKSSKILSSKFQVKSLVTLTACAAAFSAKADEAGAYDGDEMSGYLVRSGNLIVEIR